MSFDSTDLDNAVSESGVVHESVANTDHTDASELKQGYRIASPYLSANLTGYWPLQEDSGSTAFDFSGNNNDGTTTGATVNQTGLLGTSSYSFDGIDDFVDTGVPGGIGSTDSFTYLVWFNSSNSGGGAGAFMGLINTSNSQLTQLGHNGSNNLGFALRDDSGNLVQPQIATDYRDGAWHLAVGVLDRSVDEARIYIDGGTTSDTVDASSLGAITTSIDIGIGARITDGGGTDNEYTGRLCECRYLNTAISESDIQTLYDVVSTSGSLTTQYKPV